MSFLVPDPSKLKRGPQRFIQYFLLDLMNANARRGLSVFLPVRFGLCAVVGALIGFFASDALWDDMQSSIALYTAALAFSGILFAVCWSGFGKIFEVLREPGFGDWLEERKMASFFDFYVEYIQVCQMAAAIASGVGMVLVVTEAPEIVQRWALGITVTLMAYAILWTGGCVRVMQDLLDNRSKWRAQVREAEAQDEAIEA